MPIGSVASRARISQRRGSIRLTPSRYPVSISQHRLVEQTLYLTDPSTAESLLGQTNCATDHNSHNDTNVSRILSSLNTVDYVNPYTATTAPAASNSQPRDEELSLCVTDYASGGYGSAFSQIREVNREARGEIEFLSKSCKILKSTALMTVFLMMVLFLPLGMVTLGVKYLHACPKEPNIPIYLLVGGCFWMLKMFTVLWRQMRERKSAESVESLDDETQGDFIANKSTQFTDVVLSLFLLIWFGFGNYWTWKIYEPNYTMLLHEPTNWCERTLYMFTVGHILICYGCFLLFLCCIGCLCCARHICCFADKYPTR